MFTVKDTLTLVVGLPTLFLNSVAGAKDPKYSYYSTPKRKKRNKS